MALLRGTISSFDAGAHTATVRLDGSSPLALAGVRTARNIAAAEMSAGRRVIVDTGDHGNFADAVVVAVFSA